MRIKFRVIEFKTVSPFFEIERDGIKPFSIRLTDWHDNRFRALSQWLSGYTWLIKITNPATGEYFYRKLIGKRYFPGPRPSGYPALESWLIIYLGDEIKEE